MGKSCAVMHFVINIWDIFLKTPIVDFLKLHLAVLASFD